MEKYVMVIDEGTTGTRALLYDKDFHIAGQSYEEFTQYTPSEDRVEHDAEDIYNKSVEMCCKAMEQVGATAEDISCIGITNQRATTVIWDKETGKPLCKAIVWQDTRTADRCAEINASEWGKKCKQTTGWTVAPVYSSLMIEWLMKNNEEVANKLKDGSALFGTIDTWLVWKLTGGKKHTISYSNASVTGSLNLKEGKWYTEFLDYLGIPVAIYPKLEEDSGDYGETIPELFGSPIPITSCIADQHAALFAQGCRENGMAKLTNGTGSFIDLNIGENSVVMDGADTVVAWKINGKICYAIEGYAAVTGSAVQWVRDGLKFIKSSGEIEALAESVPDTNIISKALQLGGGSWGVYGLQDQGFSNDVREGAGSFQVKMYGYNYDELYEWAEKLKAKLLTHRRIKEVIINSYFSYWKDDYQEFYFNLNRERMAQENINANILFSTIRPIYGKNMEIGSVVAENGSEKIKLSSKQSQEYDIWAMQYFPYGTDDKQYKLSELATMEKGQMPQQVAKENQQYRLCLQYEYIGSGEQGNKILKRDLEEFNKELPMGYTAQSERESWGWGKAKSICPKRCHSA